jgi:hypothetical protein
MSTSVMQPYRNLAVGRLAPALAPNDRCLGSSPADFPRAEHVIYVADACDGGELGEPT